MSKNLDATIPFQSKRKQEWIRKVRGERLQGITEGRSSAPRLANLSATSLPRRNECLGTHCILIVNEVERRQFLPDVLEGLK